MSPVEIILDLNKRSLFSKQQTENMLGKIIDKLIASNTPLPSYAFCPLNYIPPSISAMSQFVQVKIKIFERKIESYCKKRRK